jgi:polyhydroxybutyrate depolymerase
MVHLLGNTYCIDLFNVYAAGHSLGGWFSNTLGCMRADVVRATASFSSGVVQRDHRLAQNSCLWEFDDTAPQSLLCEVAKQCNDGNEVVWCPHQESTTRNGTYYPHTWPSDASATVIDFFRKKIED